MQRRGQVVRVRSQAAAQKHQGPLNLGELRALALLPHKALISLRQQALGVIAESTSIIAPGREGSQLGGADTPRPAT